MIGILFVVLLVFVVGAGMFVLVREERARTRDAKRMADMARLSSAFFELYATEGTYASAAVGCGNQGASVASCALASYLPDIGGFKDPSGKPYVVSGIPGAASFVVTFVLERNYDTFSAGQHALTPEGIQ